METARGAGDEGTSRTVSKRESHRLLSVDRVTVEKNESSRKQSSKFETGKAERWGCPLSGNTLAPRSDVDARAKGSRISGGRIEPIKLTKSPAIGSFAFARSYPKGRTDGNEIEAGEAKDRSEKIRWNVEALGQNLNAKIDASTDRNKYRKKLLESRTSPAPKSSVATDANEKENEKPVDGFAFDLEFLRRHNPEENVPPEIVSDPASGGGRIDEESDETVSPTRKSAKPGYSEKVSEVERRWSGEFLENRSERRSSESSSESSYVEEVGSVSSGESVGEHRDSEQTLLDRDRGRRKAESTEEENGLGKRASEETLADGVTAASTVDSDSCLEDRIEALEALEEDSEASTREGNERAERRDAALESLNRWENRANEAEEISRIDGYANLVREFTMEEGSPRTGKEEKRKKKLGLRRLLPGFFSPKDSRKDYKKKEAKERKRQDEKYFARYQQNGNYTRSPDTMNLNEDIKRNVKLDNSLNGSMIEERLDEIKRELFCDQGPITSTPDHLAREEDRRLSRDRAGAPRSYATDSSLSSIAPDERWNERNPRLGISPDIAKFEQRHKREEFGQRYGQLERKHSLQEPNGAGRSYFFQRNHGPTGRISAPPSDRYLVRPRAIHPIDRPLPAIPRSRTELSNFADRFAEPSVYVDEPGPYANTDENRAVLVLESVSAQMKITRQPIVNQNQRAPLVGRSARYASSGSSQKSGDCGDSSCTPNSSRKSEFSPSSSKSGEYYLHSPRDSCGSPNENRYDEHDSRVEGIYENENEKEKEKEKEREKGNEISLSGTSTRCTNERIYDEAPSLPCEGGRGPVDSQRPAIEEGPAKTQRVVCPEPADRCPSTPPGCRGRTVPPFGPLFGRARPNEQILIASPKREVARETRIPRPSNELDGRYLVESPVPMTNAPRRLVVADASDAHSRDADGNRIVFTAKGTSEQCATMGFPAEMQRPEPVYGHRRRPASNRGTDAETSRVAWVPARATSPSSSLQRSCEATRAPTQKRVESESTDNDRRRQNRHAFVSACPTEKQRERYALQRQQQRTDPRSVASRITEEPIYVRRICEPIYGQRTVASTASNDGPLSPSKQATRRHLQAFYWQQKALEAQKNSLAPPVNASSRQVGRKIDLPEVRDAVYWQRLKKLDEEQQRRIYEQNPMEERGSDGKGGTKDSARASSPLAADLPVSAGYGNVRCPKVNPLGKPPLMQTQKGQNQPVLIVRPQQAIRERREIVPPKPLDATRREAQRSKSASPHFHRGESLPRKVESRSIYEAEISDADAKTTPPQPIFKRGSLIGGETVEYGSTGGAKRVSFSNQSAAPGQDLPTGSWPTKHGTAPEPPTRRHRSEDSVSDTDSVFSHQEGRETGTRCTDAEYDADRPLPPLPKDVSSANAAKPGPGPGPGPGTSNAYGDVRWNGRTVDSRPATVPQRILEQKEEEWNSDGKGRQSNDTGGSGRGDGETGSNEIPGGRRGVGGGGGSVLGGGGRSRDEPRRHTLSGDHQPSLHHQQFNAAQQLHPLHPHHLPPPHGQYGTPPTRHTTMDLEMGTKSRQRKSPLPRGGYPPPSSTMLFDDDPGIMSEVETSSTGFRRGGKPRSSLPVIRTPSKTLERPLGLVFLQYRNETKRALLPNEITSIDTVKALFVRSFPKQLTMEYLDSPHVKVYIHDSNKDMFYELEDHRSHLRDIRDRSVLRLFESTDGVTGMPGPMGIPGSAAGLPPHWEDQSYFSEPEFDSEYQHQHIHKSKTAKNSTTGSSGYYIGGSSTLPRGAQLMRAYSPAASSIAGGPNATPTQPKPLAAPGGGGVPPAKPLRSYQCGKSPLGSLGGSARFSRDSSVSLYSIADRLHGESGYMSSPERGGGVGSGTGRYPPGPYSAGSSYEDPYYSQYSGTVTPVIDEEASDTELLEESYSLYGVKPPGRPPSGPPRSPFPPGAPATLPPGGPGYDVTRIRVEHMERQLANLTGLVQKALTHAPHPSPSPRDYLQVPPGRDPYARGPGAGDEFDKHSSSSSASLPDDSYLRTDVKPPKLGKDKSVSFEKSVSFSDEPPDMNSPKQHSPQHAADTKPTKPAIKSSTLPRMSSQERDRHKPTPPPKPAALVAGQYVYRDLALTPEMYNQLRGLQKKAKDLRQEVRNLRRMSQAQAHTIRETILDTFITIRAMLLSCGDAAWDAEKIRLSREEDLYRQEMLRLKKDLTELENTVEELRGNVINKKTRVNMSDVENMALIMSKSSKTVADLKVRFPSLQEGMKGLLSSEMEMVVRAEKFLKEEPEQLELALKRCKKLTSTLVTLKRLASVQEQRLPNAAASIDAEETPPITPTSAQHSKAATPVPAERTVVGSASVVGGGSNPREPSPTAHQQRPENALDALLDELQTFSRPSSQLGHAQGSSMMLSEVGWSGGRGEAAGAAGSAAVGAAGAVVASGRAPYISDIGRKGSVDSSSGLLPTTGDAVAPAVGTLRRLHSYPSSSDTDTSPPIARLQVSLQEQPSLPALPQGFVPGQKPPVPERNAELLQLASARRVPPPPPPRTSSRSPLASPTSPQLPPRNHTSNLQNANANATLRRPPARGALPVKEGKPPMALPSETTSAGVPASDPTGTIPVLHNDSTSSQSSAVLSTSNSSSCESVNSQEGVQSKKGRQEQLEQRHQELLRKQKALQEQYARLQQLQRNTAGLTTVPPAPPDLLKKTGSESNLLAKMGLGLSAASSGSLTSLTAKPAVSQEASVDGHRTRPEESNEQQPKANSTTTTVVSTESDVVAATTATSVSSASATTSTTTSKIYETDIL